MSEIALPAAVVFDWDNTLVDSWLTIHDALNETLVAMGHEPWTLAETKARARLSLRDSFPKLFADRWGEAQKLYLASFEAIHLTRLTAFDGAAALLDSLHEAGIYLALVSNKTGRVLRAEVEALGWAGYFGAVVGAGDASADKPHRAPVDLALSGSGIDAGPDVWFVGDTGTDIECARNAGCVPVLLLPPDVEADAGLDIDALQFRFVDFAGLAAAILPSQPCNEEPGLTHF